MTSATFLSDCSKLFRTELKRPYAQKIRYNSNILWMLSIPSHNWGWVEQWHILRMASDSSQTLLKSGTSGNSRSRPSPRMKASDSLSRIMGMDFFIPPVPEFLECFFFIPFPFPNYGNGFFSFPSRSRIVGMDFFHSLPVPELWEWIFLIPFPFPNLLFHRRESKRELDYCKRNQASNFFSFLYIWGC